MLEYLNIITQHLPGLFFTGLVITILYMYVVDKTQRTHAIRHNYPILGRFRYLIEELAVFFRQYFAKERDELPFNRASRAWVYKASKDIPTTISFGSTRLNNPGAVIFNNLNFPTSKEHRASITLGENSCVETPYTTDNFFHISGMSFGALSKPAVIALSKGTALSKSFINTGEGGPSKYHYQSGADLMIQLGTAKYGFKDENGNFDINKLKTVFENPRCIGLEIKLSQSAKPGLGGILPAKKVTSEIAEERGIKEGIASISPSQHDEINSPESLFDFIYQLRSIIKKPVGFKLCVGSKVEFENIISKLSSMTAKIGDDRYIPDFITLDADGGTGAAPMSLMDATGLPMKQALPMVRNVLDNYSDTTKNIKLIASGKLINPIDVSWALCAGADLVATARGALLSMGCIQSHQCHTDKCPTGITTHNKHLQEGLDPEVKSIRVHNYIKNMHEEVNKIAKSCGVNSGFDLDRSNASILDSQINAIPMIEIYDNI